MRIKFLKNTLRNKSFDYRPMYYDERKDKLRQKVKEFDKENEVPDDETRRNALRQRMEQNWQRGSQKGNPASRAYNLRILILIFILLALGYFVFFGMDKVDVIVKKLW